jgi:O-antigen/teichoic acid export membrane protein
LSSLKSLASQTAVYGLSSIVGRLLNYLLVPIYTRVFVAGEYGVVTQVYAYVSFFTIIFTYGLETAFFRFSQKEKDNPLIYSTSLISIIGTSVGLAAIIIFLSPSISNALSSEEGMYRVLPKYISWFAIVLAFDAITVIPFAKLRQQNKALRFASIKLVNIITFVGLNLFFLVLCPILTRGRFHDAISSFYDPSFGVGYIFISNVVASIITLLLLAPEILSIKFKIDTVLWKSMMIYALPLMVAGFAGMINETFDRILLPLLLPDKSIAYEQLGIYGACYKISILMTLFVQTFRYAAEPFFFSQASNENAKEVYARVMHYFVIICSFIFLCVMMYIDVVKHFIGEEYRSGLKVAPILLIANLCLGVYFNLSIWYRLSGKTMWGAWFSIFGAVITVILNFWWIPIMGYMGAAWTTLICYASMMVISYFVGQKNYRVDYRIGSFFLYLLSSLALYLISDLIRKDYGLDEQQMFFINTGFVMAFMALVFVFERHKIPYLRFPFKK